MKKNILFLFIGVLSLSSCNDFLDREPLDRISPDLYFATANQLGTYSIARYQETFSSNNRGNYDLGVYLVDNNTDVQVSARGSTATDRWVPGVWTVPEGHGEWIFSDIYKMNYFFENVLPKWKEGIITGNKADIEHYIGEVYMLRAVTNFNKMKRFGDFPIIRRNIPLSDREALVKANERKPINEFARFIISDLDSAAMLMGARAIDDNSRNRLNRNAATIFKSRVALYAGSWLRNFSGTAFVPSGPDWPGGDKEYNKGFTINLDTEVDFFLTQAMEAAKLIADEIPLTENNQTPYDQSSNPYVALFSAKDLSIYPEVIFWNSTQRSGGIRGLGYGFAHVHNGNGGSGTGYTRAYINSFLMTDGLPIYASDSYLGDENLTNVRSGRDNRLVQFMKNKDDVSSVRNDGTKVLFVAPALLSSPEYKSTTGYDVKKGLTMSIDDKTAESQETGIIEYRAAEAYLNYIEASYLKNKNIDATAKKYWEQIRIRAGVDPNFQKTITATDMTKEKDLLSAYTAGNLVDATMFNIRRERANELMSEGFRWDDLRRWRSLDQLITQKYIVEGFKLWGEMKNWYERDGATLLRYLGDPQGSTQGNVSGPALSNYLRPHQIIRTNNTLYDGYSWMAAYYLSPIGMSQFNITSISEGQIDYGRSPLYQNPGWPTEAGARANNIPNF